MLKIPSNTSLRCMPLSQEHKTIKTNVLLHIATYEKEKKTAQRTHCLQSLFLWRHSRFQPQKDCFISSVIALERLNRDDIFVVKLLVTTACKPETLAAVWSLYEIKALPLQQHTVRIMCVCAWAWMCMSSDYTGVTRQGIGVAGQSESKKSVPSFSS